MQWVGSFCNAWHGCCPQQPGPASGFGIHGLRPAYARCHANGDALLSVVGKEGKCWPEFCGDGSLIRQDVVVPLFDTLNRQWPSVVCRVGGFNLWNEEWQQHGSCSGMDQKDYFKTALALKARSNLTGILADAGIVPSDTKTYFLSSIKDAIEKGTGFKVNLECNDDFRDEAQLYHVYQCVDREGKKFIDCPVTMPSKCTDKVKLPTIWFIKTA